MQLLFTTSRVGLYSLSHRLASASLTRVRSNEDEKPNEPLVTYDSQRASGGDLLSAEATLRVRHNPLRSAGDSGTFHGGDRRRYAVFQIASSAIGTA